MKIIFRLTLLTILTTCLLSCKSQKTYQDYYNSANKNYSNGVNFDKQKPQKAKVDACCGNCNDNNAEYYAYIASITNNVNSMNRTIDKLENQNVLEKKNSTIKEQVAPTSRRTSRNMVVNSPRRTTQMPKIVNQEPQAVAKTLVPKAMPDRPKDASKTLSNVNVPVRKYLIPTSDNANVADLKRYSVVVATLSKKDNAAKLTRSLQKAGENALFVKNDLGSYYALIGSYDKEADVLQKKDELYRNYIDKYTPQQLFKTYGIPFSDIWILEKE